MADSHSRFATLPPRQKATAIIFLMIAIFVVWEVIGMFRGSGGGGASTTAPSQPTATTTASPAPTASKPVLSQTPPAGPSRPVAAPLSSSVSVTAAPHASPQQAHPEIEMAPPPSPALLQQDQVQTKYVSALNELQMLKIQKEIAETSQAIVAAKLATATAEKSISDLLAEAEAATAPPSNKKGSSTTSINVAPLPPGPPEMVGGSYSVQSVSMEQDQWHAVVKFKKKLYDVSVGDMLPPDNSTVKAIDQRGVTLENGGFEQRVPLTVTDNVGASSDSDSSPLGSPAPKPSSE